MRIYDEMERMKLRLSDDPETKDRYERATRGGREWLAFSAWIDEDGSRWADAGVVRYRDMLADWLVLTDIAYVLQFETNPLTIAFLKDRLLPTAKRETMPERIDRKRRKLDMGLHRSFLRGTSVYGLSRQGQLLRRPWRQYAKERDEGSRSLLDGLLPWCRTLGTSRQRPV